MTGWETREIKYEQVQDAEAIFKGYALTLERLGKKVPEHIEVTLKILALIDPVYSKFHPKGG